MRRPIRGGALLAADGLYTSPRASVLISGGAMMNGDHFADRMLPVMREHFASCKSVALVLHAPPPAERDAVEKRMRSAFAHLGVPVAESLHRRDAAGAMELLRTADAIWAEARRSCCWPSYIAPGRWRSSAGWCRPACPLAA